MFSVEEYLLESVPNYHFISQGQVQVAGIDEVQEFQSTMKSMSIMGMSPEELSCESNLPVIHSLSLFFYFLLLLLVSCILERLPLS
jgi:hypothetical protein